MLILQCQHKLNVRKPHYDADSCVAGSIVLLLKSCKRYVSCWIIFTFHILISASSWDYGTYHIGDQRKLRLLSLARAFAVRTHEVWKQTKGPTKHQISSPTGWLRMRIWRMSLRRTKSAIISWDGSFAKYRGTWWYILKSFCISVQFCEWCSPTFLTTLVFFNSS